MKYPELYQSLQKGRELTPKSFLMWVCKSTYQAFIITALASIYFNSDLIALETICFTALIFTLILNVLSEITQMTWIIGGSCIASILVYMISLMLVPDWLETTPSLGFDFVQAVITLVLISWLPLYLLNYIVYKLYPTEEQRLMRRVVGSGGGFIDWMLNKIAFWKKAPPKDIQKEMIEMNEL
jgi:phospholipid-translocating ATPase